MSKKWQLDLSLEGIWEDFQQSQPTLERTELFEEGSEWSLGPAYDEDNSLVKLGDFWPDSLLSKERAA